MPKLFKRTTKPYYYTQKSVLSFLKITTNCRNIINKVLERGLKVLRNAFKVRQNAFKVLRNAFKVRQNAFKVLRNAFKVRQNAFKLNEKRFVQYYLK